MEVFQQAFNKLIFLMTTNLPENYDLHFEAFKEIHIMQFHKKIVLYLLTSYILLNQNLLMQCILIYPLKYFMV